MVSRMGEGNKVSQITVGEYNEDMRKRELFSLFCIFSENHTASVNKDNQEAGAGIGRPQYFDELLFTDQ